MNPDGVRLALGAALALGIAGAALRTGHLTPSGAIAAVLSGTAATAAGWAWCVVLLAFFVSSSALSRWRRVRKELATRDVVEKPGARDLVQVAANGGVFTLCAAAFVVHPTRALPLAAIGALAAAAADTWATEVGIAVGRSPRALGSFALVPPGTSGAVSLAGSAAMVGGALFMGTVARLAGFDPALSVAAGVGGVAGALADTVIGATVQERRWCPTCERSTEQRVHRCHTPTIRSGGWPMLTNDLVNLTSTVVGAVAAVAVAAWRS